MFQDSLISFLNIGNRSSEAMSVEPVYTVLSCANYFRYLEE
jgi:hypothetical protein